MIVRRYGSSYPSVRTNFDPSALTEIGFRRDHSFSMPASEFAEKYAIVATYQLSAEAEGDMHRDAERELLAKLDEAIFVARENRLRFHWSVAPTLRLAVHRPVDAAPLECRGRLSTGVHATARS